MTTTKQDLWDKPRVGLHWLLRLRWFAIGGQVLLYYAAYEFLDLELPVRLLASCVAIAVISNIVLEWLSRRQLAQSRNVCTAVLGLDTVLLTTILYATGGAHNPFTAFYLLHVTIAAILLPPLSAWLSVVLCGVCYGLLFKLPPMVGGGADCCDSFGLHLQGMLLAMIMSGAGIAYFVSKLSADLVRRETQLAEARLLSARNERFAALATLAAGVAHELATPLGTIAVVSSDLERGAPEADTNRQLVADARLVRAEVERCREILKKLSSRTTNGVGDPPEVIDLANIPSLIKPYLKEPHRSRVTTQIASKTRSFVAPQITLLQSIAVLIKNSCEATAPNRLVRLVIHDAPRAVRFTVQDEGTGMSDVVARRAGEPFFTTKDPGEGMGLGLFLVRTFVERMSGQLDIESEPGRGTTVHLTLPMDAAGSAT